MNLADLRPVAELPDHAHTEIRRLYVFRAEKRGGDELVASVCSGEFRACVDGGFVRYRSMMLSYPATWRLSAVAEKQVLRALRGACSVLEFIAAKPTCVEQSWVPEWG